MCPHSVSINRSAGAKEGIGGSLCVCGCAVLLLFYHFSSRCAGK